MIIWGLLSISTGLTQGFWGALTSRFLLGFVEAAFFPSAIFMLSKWYTRKELGSRTALFTCGMLVSNAFGALIASAVLDSMQGVLGFAAWRWLFFIEGGLTVVVAISAFYVLPDFPEKPAPWLTHAELELARQRMIADAGKGAEGADNQTEGFFLAMRDGKVSRIPKILVTNIEACLLGVVACHRPAVYGYIVLIQHLLPDSYFDSWV